MYAGWLNSKMCVPPGRNILKYAAENENIMPLSDLMPPDPKGHVSSSRVL
jgi:hypothetical protein